MGTGPGETTGTANGVRTLVVVARFRRHQQCPMMMSLEVELILFRSNVACDLRWP